MQPRAALLIERRSCGPPTQRGPWLNKDGPLHGAYALEPEAGRARKRIGGKEPHGIRAETADRFQSGTERVGLLRAAEAGDAEARSGASVDGRSSIFVCP